MVWRDNPQGSFLVLYGIACDKDELIAAHLDSASGSIQWDVNFIQAARDWQVDVLASIRVRREGEDKVWWAPSHKGKFDVRSFYKVLPCKDEVLFPWKSIWHTTVPLKAAFFFFFFFAWSAAFLWVSCFGSFVSCFWIFFSGF